MTGIRMRSREVITLAVLVALGTACGPESGGGSGGAGAGAGYGAGGGDATETTSGGGAMGGGAMGGGMGGGTIGGGGDDSGSTAIAVQVNNFLFAPSNIEVPAGSEIEVKNGNANTPHTFTVEGTGIDLELSPMASEDVTIDLDPGGYDVICRFHGQMSATLTVT